MASHSDTPSIWPPIFEAELPWEEGTIPAREIKAACPIFFAMENINRITASEPSQTSIEDSSAVSLATQPSIDYKTLSLLQLRTFLKSRNIKANGNKAELVKRLRRNDIARCAARAAHIDANTTSAPATKASGGDKEENPFIHERKSPFCPTQKYSLNKVGRWARQGPSAKRRPANSQHIPPTPTKPRGLGLKLANESLKAGAIYTTTRDEEITYNGRPGRPLLPTSDVLDIASQARRHNQTLDARSLSPVVLSDRLSDIFDEQTVTHEAEESSHRARCVMCNQHVLDGFWYLGHQVVVTGFRGRRVRLSGVCAESRDRLIDTVVLDDEHTQEWNEYIHRCSNSRMILGLQLYQLKGMVSQDECNNPSEFYTPDDENIWLAHEN